VARTKNPHRAALRSWETRRKHSDWKKGERVLGVQGAAVVDLPRAGETLGEHAKRVRMEWAKATGFDNALSASRRPAVSHHEEAQWEGKAVWGASHSGSTAITGEAAAIMGIGGYRRSENSRWTEERLGHESEHAKHAKIMLRAIASDAIGSEETLYHGFEDLDAEDWAVGDTLRIPTTATAGDPDSITYGMRLDADTQRGISTLFVFEKGTQMMAYNKWAGPEEFGFNYSEAIVAGGFEVTGVDEAPYPFLHAWKNDGAPMVKIVKLRQTEAFDPVTKKWRKRHG
jgi:hypothetical protein